MSLNLSLGGDEVHRTDCVTSRKAFYLSKSKKPYTAKNTAKFQADCLQKAKKPTCV